MDSASTSRAYLYLIVTAICFGMNVNLGRLAVGEVSPMLIVSLRWIGTICLLMIFARSRFIADLPKLRSHIPFLLLMGMLGLTAFNGLFYVAAYTTTALNIGIIQGSIPMLVLVGVFLLYRTRIQPLQVFGIIATMIGIGIVTTNGSLDRLLTLGFQKGDLLMIIACVLYAGYSVGLRSCPTVNPLSLFTVFALGALVASIPLTAIEIYTGGFQWPTPRGWGILALITVFPSFIAQLSYIKGVAIIGPGRAGVFINLVPIFAAIIAVVFLNEVFALFHGIALFLILGGIAISEWGKKATG